MLLSPTKTLNYLPFHINASIPRLLKHSDELIGILKKKSSTDIGKLMKLSSNLVSLNTKRYKDYMLSENVKYKDDTVPEGHKQAAVAFKGPAFQALDPESFSQQDWEFSQKHLRVLSGLYGVLRPQDVIQPYRLEMGTKLKTDRGKNLYEFWGSTISELLYSDLEKNKKKIFIINAASNEYFNSVDIDFLKSKGVIIYNVVFKEAKNGGFRIVSVYAKQARGLLCRYVIQNKVTDIENLKKFNLGNYKYRETFSSETELVFTRSEKDAKDWKTSTAKKKAQKKSTPSNPKSTKANKRRKK